MSSSSQLGKQQKEDETIHGKEAGARLVIAGGIAAIILWMIVLALGNPIRPFVNPLLSFGYALVVSSPAIFLSIVAILKKMKRK